jgi:hypothetical protein
VEEGSCTSVKHGEEPDMRLGDICVWCACRECERCGFLIDLDCEKRVSDGQGYIDVCADCLTEDDKPYDQDDAAVLESLGGDLASTTDTDTVREFMEAKAGIEHG